MNEPIQPKPKSHFGKIVLVNLGVVVAVHVGRQLIDSDSTILGFLLVLWLLNAVVGLLLLVTGERGNGLACWLSAMLIGIAGVSECGTHLHLGGMH
ncbi:hypothetical protein MON38_02835 [Hymenobacter sp. DH14]|uniref:Uncharacterized protein n=1 Tax=Hymenobacter cyanobacteriorum TaxID=2926463 RepID=A0A9X2AGH9_9BACT|nr:hypothetical protein [Hymenobacter cyanobacteriorum]MCI1186340.1 hypothetical protein [Hymenobacter cyanobacteriorum]